MAVLVIQIYLIYHRDKDIKDGIVTFLESSIGDDSYNLSLSKDSDFSKRVNSSLNILKKRTLERETQFETRLNLLNSIIQQIKTGVVLFNKDGEVLELNRASRLYLGCSYISNINETVLAEQNEIKDFSKEISNSLISVNGENLLLDSSTLEFNSEKIRILTIQNIKPLLNEQELNSWNRLIRSLNHELMNSIAPISSLASTAVKLLDENSNPGLSQALKVIEARSSNLLKFIDSYKKLAQLPEPNKKLIKLQDFLKEIKILMSKTYRDIKINIDCDESCYLYADTTQMEQVVINLIKNSIEADSTTIKIYVEESDQTIIEIRDNGRGFNKETLDKAFIPFYSTKESGSGLGLSIVKQLLLLNEGKIEINPTKPGSIIKITF